MQELAPLSFALACIDGADAMLLALLERATPQVRLFLAPLRELVGKRTQHRARRAQELGAETRRAEH